MKKKYSNKRKRSSGMQIFNPSLNELSFVDDDRYGTIRRSKEAAKRKEAVKKAEKSSMN